MPNFSCAASAASLFDEARGDPVFLALGNGQIGNPVRFLASEFGCAGECEQFLALELCTVTLSLGQEGLGSTYHYGTI